MDYACYLLILLLLSATNIFIAEPISECWPPMIPMNGSLTNVKQKYLAGDKITYQCDDGFVLFDGKRERTCQTSRSWTGEMPFCDKQFKLKDPIIEGLDRSTPDVQTVIDKNVTTCFDITGKGIRIFLPAEAILRTVRVFATNAEAINVEVSRPRRMTKLTCGTIRGNYGDKRQWKRTDCRDKMVGNSVCLRDIGSQNQNKPRAQICEVEIYGTVESNSSCNQHPEKLEEPLIPHVEFIVSREKTMIKCKGEGQNKIYPYLMCENNKWQPTGQMCHGREEKGKSDGGDKKVKKLIIAATVVSVCLAIGCIVGGVIYYLKKKQNSVVVVVKHREYYNCRPENEDSPQDHEYSTIIYEDIPLTPSQIRKIYKKSPTNLPDILTEYVQPSDRRKANGSPNAKQCDQRYNYIYPQDAIPKDHAHPVRLKESPFYGE